MLKMTVPGKPKGQAFSAWKTEPEGHCTEIKIPHCMHETVKPFHDSILLQSACLQRRLFLRNGYILMNKQTNVKVGKYSSSTNTRSSPRPFPFEVWPKFKDMEPSLPVWCTGDLVGVEPTLLPTLLTSLT